MRISITQNFENDIMNKIQHQTIWKQIGDYTYNLQNTIGSGYSSTVYKGHHIKNGQIVAIKVISMADVNTQIAITLLKNEISVLLQLNNQNLLKVFEIYESSNNTYIITEYCEDGDLADQIEQNPLPEQTALYVLNQLINGLKALKELKICHRDIKPANILRSKDTYKLADFGFALIQNQQQSIIKKFHVGTPLYMAPEIVESNFYSEKSDIWSLGVVLYQMIYQLVPFNSKNDVQLLRMQQKGLPWVANNKNLCQTTKTLILGMLNTDPIQRFGIFKIDQILNPKIPKELNIKITKLTDMNGAINESLTPKLKLKFYQSPSQDDSKKRTMTLTDTSSLELKEENPFTQAGKKRLGSNKSIYIPNINRLIKSDTLKNSFQDEVKQIDEIMEECQITLSDREIKLSKFNNQNNKNVLYLSKEINAKTLLKKALDQFCIEKDSEEKDKQGITLKNNVYLSPPEKKSQQQQQKSDEDNYKSRMSTEISSSTKSNENIDQLPATVRPTFRFCQYLDLVLNQLQPKTQENDLQLKCYFVVKKFQAIKAQQIQKDITEAMEFYIDKWIVSFKKYFRECQNYTYRYDEQFIKIFNSSIIVKQQEYCCVLLKIIDDYIQKEPNQELQIVMEVIQENQRQLNDCVLFARKWENQ